MNAHQHPRKITYRQKGITDSLLTHTNIHELVIDLHDVVGSKVGCGFTFNLVAFPGTVTGMLHAL